MDFAQDVVENIWAQRFFWSVIVIIVSVILYKIISGIFERREKHKSTLLINKKGRTVARMFKSVIRYTLIILDGLIILQIFGVDLSSMLTVTAIASVIVAFSIQDALKDIIRGLDIVSDNYYNVGDVVKIGETEGKVLAVGLKTTKIHDISTGNMVSIANRNIVEAEVVSGLINIDVPLSPKVSIARAEKVLTEISEKLKEIEGVSSAEYRKITDFSDTSIDYRLRIVGSPAQRFQIRRDCLDIITRTLISHKLYISSSELGAEAK